MTSITVFKRQWASLPAFIERNRGCADEAVDSINRLICEPIEADPNSCDTSFFRSIRYDLQIISALIGAEALLRFCYQDTAAWSMLRRSLAYLELSVRADFAEHIHQCIVRDISLKAVEERPRDAARAQSTSEILAAARAQGNMGVIPIFHVRSHPNIQEAVNTAFMSISLMHPEFAKWTAKTIFYLFATPEKVHVLKELETLDFLPFALDILALWLGTEPKWPHNKNKQNRYRDCIASWNSPAAFQQKFDSVCDLHFNDRMREKTLNLFTAFPLTIFPAEVLAILSIRKDLGIHENPFQHRILQPEMFQAPPFIVHSDDPLLLRLQERWRQEFPTLAYLLS